MEDLLYHSFVGSTVISLIFCIFNGEMVEGTSFLLTNGSVVNWFIFILFCTAGFIGSNFSTSLTLRFGSLVNGITNTTRKAITLALSFALFPERNRLTSHHILGASIFFLGLIMRSLLKEKLQKQPISPKLDHKTSFDVRLDVIWKPSVPEAIVDVESQTTTT